MRALIMARADLTIILKEAAGRVGLDDVVTEADVESIDEAGISIVMWSVPPEDEAVAAALRRSKATVVVIVPSEEMAACYEWADLVLIQPVGFNRAVEILGKIKGWGTCPLCGSSKKPKVLRQLGHGELHQCPDCGQTYKHIGESYVGRD